MKTEQKVLESGILKYNMCVERWMGGKKVRPRERERKSVCTYSIREEKSDSRYM